LNDDDFGGVHGTKKAALEGLAVTVAFSVREGNGVQIDEPAQVSYANSK
jgi:hypothetical protein